MTFYLCIRGTVIGEDERKRRRRRTLEKDINLLHLTRNQVDWLRGSIPRERERDRKVGDKQLSSSFTPVCSRLNARRLPLVEEGGEEEEEDLFYILLFPYGSCSHGRLYAHPIL